MSRFDQVDLSKLPSPTIIQEVSFDDLMEQSYAIIDQEFPELSQSVRLISDPMHKVLRVCAKLRELDVQEFNENAKALLLAFSWGAPLDHIGANFGVERDILQEADDIATPPIPLLMEDDGRYKTRIQQSHEKRSVAGPDGAYVNFVMDTDPRIKDVSVEWPIFEHLEWINDDEAKIKCVYKAGLNNPLPGMVAITVLMNDGTPSADLDAIQTYLKDLRPATDLPVLRHAEIIPYQIDAELTLLPGPDGNVIKEQSLKKAKQYVQDHLALGRDINRAIIEAALYVEGVQNINLIAPANDLEIAPYEAGMCEDSNINLRVVGRDV